MAYNVPALGEVANFGTDYFLSKIKFLARNKREFTTKFAILPNACCKIGFIFHRNKLYFFNFTNMKTKKELFSIQLSEAKDLLIHINDSIRETRNRLFYLLTLMLAVFGYSVTDIIDGKFYSLKSYIFYSVIVFGGIIIYHTRKAITPLNLRFNGITPENFGKITSETKKKSRINILYTYQKSIEVNGKHLTEISTSYNKAFKTLLYWLIFVCCITAWCFIIQSYVC